MRATAALRGIPRQRGSGGSERDRGGPCAEIPVETLITSVRPRVHALPDCREIEPVPPKPQQRSSRGGTTCPPRHSTSDAHERRVLVLNVVRPGVEIGAFSSSNLLSGLDVNDVTHEGDVGVDARARVGPNSPPGDSAPAPGSDRLSAPSPPPATGRPGRGGLSKALAPPRCCTCAGRKP